MNTAYISIGSNLGKRIENCRNGIERLVSEQETELSDISRFYRTEPVGYADQPWFVNGVFSIRTVFSPVLLLKRLKRAEREWGRIDTGIRNGPRVIDLDIIFFNDVIMDTGELIIPHPRMHQRRFVLLPLCDIAPDMIHPAMGVSVSRLLEALPDSDQECRPVIDEKQEILQ